MPPLLLPKRRFAKTVKQINKGKPRRAGYDVLAS
jgi:hypothetical protein